MIQFLVTAPFQAMVITKTQATYINYKIGNLLTGETVVNQTTGLYKLISPEQVIVNIRVDCVRVV